MDAPRKFVPAGKAGLFVMAATLMMPLMPGAAYAQDTEAAAGQTRADLARDVVLLYFPEENREETLRGMLDPIFDTMIGSIMQNGKLQEALREKPKARKVFDDFIVGEREEAIQMLDRNFPMLMDAMAGAYARNMTTDELVELRTYLQTDSGQSFIKVSMNIFSDPDVQAAQQAMMAQSFEKMPAKTEKLMADLRAALEES